MAVRECMPAPQQGPRVEALLGQGGGVQRQLATWVFLNTVRLALLRLLRGASAATQRWGPPSNVLQRHWPTRAPYSYAYACQACNACDFLKIEKVELRPSEKGTLNGPETTPKPKGS